MSPTPSAARPLAPRPYQSAAIDGVRRCMAHGKRRVCLVVPTGGGKTVIAGEIVRRTVAAGRRVLFLAHRAELVDQAYETLTRFGLKVGAWSASSSYPPNPYAPVQVASVQTLLARRERPPADLIVADECHHFGDAAETFTSVLRHYESAFVLGLTATPERGDGSPLDVFQELVVGATTKQLTDDGHLVPCHVMRPDAPLRPRELAQDPVEAYLEHASGRRAILFARSVALSEEYAASFNAAGVVARAISAETPWAERRLYRAAFRRGAIQVLTSVMVLTEGFDDPGVSCCIIARGCGSAGMYLQLVGRVLRPAPGKRDAVLLDLRGVSHEHGLPTDERVYSLEGRGIRLTDPNSYCSVCGGLKAPGEPCAECGPMPTSDEGGKPDRVVGIPLKPYHKLRETDDDAMRAVRLGRWIGDAERRGFKLGWASKKFEAVYGAPPSAEVWRAAQTNARERGNERASA